MTPPERQTMSSKLDEMLRELYEITCSLAELSGRTWYRQQAKYMGRCIAASLNMIIYQEADPQGVLSRARYSIYERQVRSGIMKAVRNQIKVLASLSEQARDGAARQPQR